MILVIPFPLKRVSQIFEFVETIHKFSWHLITIRQHLQSGMNRTQIGVGTSCSNGTRERAKPTFWCCRVAQCSDGIGCSVNRHERNHLSSSGFPPTIYHPTDTVIVQFAIKYQLKPSITMKFAAIAFAATLAVASAAECELAKLTPIAGGADATGCTSDSGFILTNPSVPSGAALTKLCSSAHCQATLESVLAVLPADDCTFLGKNVKADIITPLQAACAKATGGSAAGSSASAAPVAGTTTATPAAGSGTGSIDGSTTGSDGTTSGGDGKVVPTPAPSAAISTIAASAGAVVAAIFATLF